jgi:hypothetical protein
VKVERFDLPAFNAIEKSQKINAVIDVPGTRQRASGIFLTYILLFVKSLFGNFAS